MTTAGAGQEVQSEAETARDAKRSRSPPSKSAFVGDAPALSVILPVYNAMPWLPIAVRDMLKQDLGDGRSLELICANDASRDDGPAFLRELAQLMGTRAACEKVLPPQGALSVKKPRVESHVSKEDKTSEDTVSTNPAFSQALRAAETEDHHSFKDQDEPEDVKQLRENPITAADVFAECRPEHRLLFLEFEDGVNRGQGAAMSLCLSRVAAPFLAQMESDDERKPTDAFAKMLACLQENPDWDGVSCGTTLVGWDRPGMQRYVDWQNSLVTPADMAQGRFVEIPALHQTAMFRTCSVLEVTKGSYRDGPAPAGSQEEGDGLDVPVDYYFWLAFFHNGKRCGKVRDKLFGWRQHPRQHTRTHGRLSIDNLRKIKVHFLLRPDNGPAHGRHVQVWSVGKTLDDWTAELQACPFAPLSVSAVSWKPTNTPAPPVPASGPRPIRLFAYGSPKVRQRVRQLVKDWDDQWDWFVA